jgi:chromate transporter
MNERLLGLVLVFVPLSLLSFGGGQAIIADMQHQTVDVHGWLTDTQFVDLFAVSRAAPGPTTLIAALIGWQVAGLAGAVVAALAIYVPSSVIVYAASRWWHRHQGSAWRETLERGLAPVAVGLIFAGVYTVIRAARLDWIGLAALGAALVLLLTTRISAYALMGAAAILFAALQLIA